MDASDRQRGRPDRRRFPRLEVIDEVHGELVPLEVPLAIRDLGDGGFSILSAKPFPPGTAHRFRFITGTDAQVDAAAVAVHCRLTGASASGEFWYVTGFEFATDQPNQRAVAAILELLAVPSFE